LLVVPITTFGEGKNYNSWTLWWSAFEQGYPTKKPEAAQKTVPTYFLRLSPSKTT